MVTYLVRLTFVEIARSRCSLQMFHPAPMKVPCGFSLRVLWCLHMSLMNFNLVIQLATPTPYQEASLSLSSNTSSIKQDAACSRWPDTNWGRTPLPTLVQSMSDPRRCSCLLNFLLTQSRREDADPTPGQNTLSDSLSAAPA